MVIKAGPCLLVLLSLLTGLMACHRHIGVSDGGGPAIAQPQPISIILLIGDGMGFSQVSTAFFFGEGTNHFQRFEKIGLSITESSSHKVTDSAAGATAIAAGIKSYNRAIAVSADTIHVPTIMEQLRDQQGYLTRLVSLTSITHATPACFYAHVKDRDLHEEIARQLSLSRVDFFAGGGLKYFTEREDGTNLYAAMRAQGYHLDSTQLGPVRPDSRNGFFLARESLPSKVAGRGDFLPDATRMALEYFEAKGQPFFLMAEGSYIDWAGHAEDADMLIQEVKDFNKTIGMALDYVEKHPNTLLIVTADHETGGVSLDKKYQPVTVFGQQQVVPGEVQINFSSNQHSAALVPVFAKGPGEDYFQGIYPNYEIYHRLLKALAH